MFQMGKMHLLRSPAKRRGLDLKNRQLFSHHGEWLYKRNGHRDHWIYLQRLINLLVFFAKLPLLEDPQGEWRKGENPNVALGEVQ